MPTISTSKNKMTSLLHLLFKVQQDLDSLLLGQTGIGLSAYRILSTLDDKVTYSQRQIAVELSQTEANISRQIRHMAEYNLVKIAPDKKDKRQRNISLTSKGQKKFSAAQKVLAHNEAAILNLIKRV